MKKAFKLPFDTGFLDLELDESQVAGVLTPHHTNNTQATPEADIVREALANPVDSPASATWQRARRPLS